MELLNGGDLCDFVNQMPHRNEANLCNIIKTLNDALEYCHFQGVTHRNLKPENIMVNVEHGNPIIKILDFGVARIVGEEMLANSYGSLIFQSPEAVAGKPVEAAGDFWALGVIMYLL
jgi:serine/threonine protein kinase